jgi:Zn-dependent oligopeptidase
MENLDVILLTTVVVIAFVIFIVTSVQEFSKMEDKPYKFEKASGFNRAVLFNLLSSLFDEEEFPEKNREKFKNTLKRTIADMETDGVYFDKEAKESLKEKPKKSPEGGKDENN